MSYSTTCCCDRNHGVLSCDLRTSVTVCKSYCGGCNPRLSPVYYNHPQKIQGHSFCPYLEWGSEFPIWKKCIRSFVGEGGKTSRMVRRSRSGYTLLCEIMPIEFTGANMRSNVPTMKLSLLIHTTSLILLATATRTGGISPCFYFDFCV